MSSFPVAPKRARGAVRCKVPLERPRQAPSTEEDAASTNSGSEATSREDVDEFNNANLEWCKVPSLAPPPGEPCSSAARKASLVEQEAVPLAAVPAWARWPGARGAAQAGSRRHREDVDHWAPLPNAAFDRICIEFKDPGEDTDEAASTYDDGDIEDIYDFLDWEELFGSEVDVVSGCRADVGPGHNLPAGGLEDDEESEVADAEALEGEDDERRALRRQAVGSMSPHIWGGSADPAAKVTHIIFVVHGIGATFQNLQKNLRDLKDNFHAMQKYWFWHTNINVHVEMIDWKSSLTEAQTSIWNRITPNEGSSRSTRMSLNSTLGDVIFYKTAHHRSKIHDIVTQKMNLRLRLLRADPSERFRDAGVSIVGHSLGSVIAYDVLTNYGSEEDAASALDFKVDNFFLWGSPLAAFVSIADEDHERMRLVLPEGLNTYNIFHPHDPVAFRLEPLQQAASEVSPPEVVPYYANNGTRPSKQWTQSYEYAKGLAHQKWTSFKSRLMEAVGSEGLADDMRIEWENYLNGENFLEGRGPKTQKLDFQLQELAMEAAWETYGMLQSHFCYWTSHDVALMVLKKISAQDTAELNADERDQRELAAKRKLHEEAGLEDPLPVGPLALLQHRLPTTAFLAEQFSDMPCLNRGGEDADDW